MKHKYSVTDVQSATRTVYCLAVNGMVEGFYVLRSEADQEGQRIVAERQRKDEEGQP